MNKFDMTNIASPKVNSLFDCISLYMTENSFGRQSDKATRYALVETWVIQINNSSKSSASTLEYNTTGPKQYEKCRTADGVHHAWLLLYFWILTCNCIRKYWTWASLDNQCFNRRLPSSTWLRLATRCFQNFVDNQLAISLINFSRRARLFFHSTFSTNICNSFLAWYSFQN